VNEIVESFRWETIAKGQLSMLQRWTQSTALLWDVVKQKKDSGLLRQEM